MKKNKLTFADRARQIKNRYKNASFDPMQAQEMEDALDALMEEQESIRETMGLNSNSDKYKCGGKMYALGGSDNDSRIITNPFMPYFDPTNSVSVWNTPSPVPNVSGMSGVLRPTEYTRTNTNTQPVATSSRRPISLYTIPKEELAIPNRDLAAYNSAYMNREAALINNSIQNTIPGKSFVPSMNNSLIPMDTLSEAEISNLNKESQRALPFGTKIGDTLRNLSQSEYLPTAISGITNIAGNLLLSRMARKNRPLINAVSATPEKINLEPVAEDLRRRAAVSRNIASVNARNLGLNPMQSMAGMSTAGTSIDRTLGEALSNLYMQQESANIGAANQFALSNAANQQRVNELNTELAQRGLENRMGYLSGAISTIPSALREVNLIKRDRETRNWWDNYLRGLRGSNYKYSGSPLEGGQLMLTED